MGIAVHGQWETLSSQFAEVAEQADKFVVAVHGGRRLAASGIAWRAGIVVTANHMLRRADDIEITFADKSKRTASLVGRDPGTDIAVLRTVNSESGAPTQLGSVTGLRVGQLVLAVGRSTLGDLAASAGIVARLGGPWQTWRGGKIDSLLRPDVTLYPGQSGSALLDSQAHVLGMNTSALARAAAITVPTQTIERVVGEILEHGGVFRPYLGLAMQPVALPRELASKLKIEGETALMVMQVEPDSPSAEAGITLGDIVLKINEQPVSGIDDIQAVLGRAKRGDSVALGYARGGGFATAKLKLADRPRR
ncbi:MAG TPA: trypsin-like peptidase domain-containing protein [Terriglobales bacterium]|nr:trypsin-like peptidase domain-containing protein [Terriglobales bacterium]